MSPRRTTSASPSGSSSGRRSPRTNSEGQPKTSREQFSACGACRMRRVRCDLKDLPMHKSGRHPSCTNCRERGLKCVDEYGQVKSVKLLRRGRRLQQAEALYGKVQPGEEEDILFTGPMPPTNVTPMLKPEFFESQFWRRFHLQRPVIEPSEFCVRFASYSKGKSDSLGVPGRLLAMSLVIWASSFGFNERGQPIDTFEDQLFQYQEQKINTQDNYDTQACLRVRNERKTKTNEMLKEMLYLIDVHGILRKPSWDGVRLLLMILPLTQDVQSNMERTSMYESTINLVYTLSTLPSASPVNSGEGEYIDGLVRARTFWYSIVHDWMVNGLRGSRIFLTDCDLRSFEDTLPHLDRHPPSDSLHYQTYTNTVRFFTLPLQLSSACRLVHSALTGPEARGRNLVDAEKLQQAWDILDKAWQDLSQNRSVGVLGTMLGPEEVERYAASWQIFMFECYNVIREALKSQALHPPERSLVPDHGLAGVPSPSHDYYSNVNKLYNIARTKCLYLVQAVVSIIKRYLGTQFFQYDAFLVRDGVYYAGFLLASEGIGEFEDVNLCLSAMREMRWVYSMSEDRERKINMVWQATRANRHHPAAPSSGQTRYTGPVLGQQYARPTSLPRVELSHLVTGSPAPTSTTDDPWPASGVSSAGGSDSGSPNSYVANHSPVDPTSNLQVMEPTHMPYANEPYSTQYVSGQQQTQFDQYRYPHLPKPEQFDNQSTTMYYQQEFHPSVANYYAEPTEESVATPAETLPGPSNYQSHFYYPPINH